MNAGDHDEDAATAFAPWRTSYRSADHDLPGYFITPPPDHAPFPAIVFHHGGSGLRPSARTAVMALVDFGYAVFVPIRRGLDATAAESLVARLEAECDDAVAALDWLRRQDAVEPTEIAMIGSSTGGELVLLAAARQAPFAAGVTMAAGSTHWATAPELRDRLRDAVRTSTTPLFLIQAADDTSLTPTYELGAELARGGTPHEVRIYEPVARERGGGHGIFGNAVDLWLPDVRRFLNRVLGVKR